MAYILYLYRRLYGLRLNIKRFQREGYFAYLKRIVSLQPKEALYCDKWGRLTKGSNPWKYRRFWLLNLLTLNSLRLRVRMGVYHALLLFCQELENPLVPHQILKRMAQKRRLFSQMIDHLKAYPYFEIITPSYVALIKGYERGSYLQIRIIKEAIRRTDRQPVVGFYKESKEALKKRIMPRKIGGRTSGAYIVFDRSRKKLALFKPFDEESCTPNNFFMQASLGRRCMRVGLRSGESLHREVACYQVDRFFQLGIVPETVYAKLSHEIFMDFHEGERLFDRKVKEKRGSLQYYLHDWVHVTPKERKDSMRSLHQSDLNKLMFLDIIAGNADRHIMNLLIKDNRIMAIDNGMTFLDKHLQYAWDWIWGFYGATIPFIEEIAQMALNFSVENLIAHLKSHCSLEINCYQKMKERIALLRAGIRAQLSPIKIRQLFCLRYIKQCEDLDQTLDQVAEEITRQFLKESHKRSIKRSIIREIQHQRGQP